MTAAAPAAMPAAFFRDGRHRQRCRVESLHAVPDGAIRRPSSASSLYSPADLVSYPGSGSEAHLGQREHHRRRKKLRRVDFVSMFPSERGQQKAVWFVESTGSSYPLTFVLQFWRVPKIYGPNSKSCWPRFHRWCGCRRPAQRRYSKHINFNADRHRGKRFGRNGSFSLNSL